MPDREKIIGLLQETAEYFLECRSNASFASKAENKKHGDDIVRCKDYKFKGNINFCPLAYIEKTEQFTALRVDEWFCGNGKRK